MRILLFNWRDLAHPSAGGAEVYTHEILSRWVRAGHEVTWFCAEVPGQPSQDEVSGIRVIRSGNALTVYRAAAAFYARHGRRRYDMVIDEVNTRPFGCARWVRDAPVVCLIYQVAREVWFSQLSWPLAMMGRYCLEPWWLRSLRYVPTMTLSESSRQSLLAYGLQQVLVAPLGVSAPADLGDVRREEAPTLVFVGRMTANKRPEEAVEALRLLRRRQPDARLWLVGDGPMVSELRRRNEPGVTIFGRVSDREKFELMARAHLLVMTSVREGWGLVVNEAAAVGTRAIGYDVSGLRDSIPSAGGILTTPDPASLASAIDQALPAARAVTRPQPIPHTALSWDAAAASVLDLAVAACRLRYEIARRPPEPVFDVDAWLARAAAVTTSSG